MRKRRRFSVEEMEELARDCGPKVHEFLLEVEKTTGLENKLKGLLGRLGPSVVTVEDVTVDRAGTATIVVKGKANEICEDLKNELGGL